ncbi:MAG: UDP-4-amino-4,6-dideoxy-N-acetyl-beta-L-altrosamine transaminase [Pseudomonadota bacterium]
MIPYSRQSIAEADIDAVVEALRSDFLTTGPRVAQFEERVARYCHAPYAVAVNSGTSALHLACLALGLGAGDRLWTIPNTFVASANCALMCGAEVGFVDIEPGSGNIDVDDLERRLASAARDGRLPKVLVAVHFAGSPCDLQRIAKLCTLHNVRIIEDASHALGAWLVDEPIGAGLHSDITVFSFHPVKSITAAEGGLATTRSEELFQKMQMLRTHGVTRDEDLFTRSDGPWYYEQHELGFNYRMSDLHAALGSSQMSRLDDFVAARAERASKYDAAFADLPITTLERLPQARSAHHLYVLLIDQPSCGLDRAQMFKQLRAAGIGVNVHYIPVHTQPYYQQRGFAKEDFPASVRYYDQALSIPIYPDLSDEDQQFVIDQVEGALS